MSSKSNKFWNIQLEQTKIYCNLPTKYDYEELYMPATSRSKRQWWLSAMSVSSRYASLSFSSYTQILKGKKKKFS